MEPYEARYLDFYDDLRLPLNLNRFKKLSQTEKDVLMKAFLKVLCRHSEYLPLMRNSVELGIIERTSTYSAQTFNKFYKTLKELQKPSPKVKITQPIKIELGCLPTSDFVFSQNPINLPDFYKSKMVIPAESSNMEFPATQQFPVNILLGNVNIFKYFNAIRYLGQPTNLPNTQVPVHSYITYLWGAAIDQYYQVALQNNLL